MAQPSELQVPGRPSAQTPADDAETLVQMIMAFRISQMIFVAAKLGIADLLADGPRQASVLAVETGTHAASLYRLLRSLASLGIFERDSQDRFGLTPLAELLQSGTPGSMRTRSLNYGTPEAWSAWGDLLNCVTTGETAYSHLYGMDVWKYREQNPAAGMLFDEFMAANTTRQTAAILSAYDFSGIKRVVDVGGGRGALISGILKANPQLRGILCDAPHVLAGAGANIEDAGLRDRCELAPCDFFASVPGGGDIYLLKFIIHDWPDDQALAILNTCRRAMQPNAKLLVVEHVVQPGNDPDPAKLIDLQMLVEQGGRERTEEELRLLLGKAGFELTRCVSTEAAIYIIEAKPI